MKNNEEMEDETDIYADLPNFNTEDNDNLAEKNKKISEKCAKLEKQVNDLTLSLESVKKINNNLEVNLSSLLQTAKAEIARKDRMIADIRRQLDNMQFRRGEYGKSSKQSRRSPARTTKADSPARRKQIAEEVPDLIDATEFLCDNPPPIENEDRNGVNKSHQFNGIVSTVFGERLRKRILEEQEEERKQKEQFKAKEEQVFDSGLNSDTLKLDDRLDSVVGSKSKGSSIGSNNSSNPREDASFSKRNHSDRKRQSENKAEAESSRKRLKNNDGRSRYRDNSRHSDRGTRGSSRTSVESKSKERRCAEIVASDDRKKRRIVGEDLAAVENRLDNKSESVSTALADETQDRHNRVAIRLMLLAEGIDPDLEGKKAVENEEKKIVFDKGESRRKSRDTSRSRSESKSRRHSRRSRSRTPSEHRKGRKRSRQRENGYGRSKDRFERRRESKNKDGDNLSEFSREICELKDKIDHRIDDRASKGRDFKRHKRNDERIYKTGRSRTLDRSRSASKERTGHGSRVVKQSGRSQLPKRHESRNRGKRYSDVDDIPIEAPKTGVPITEKTEVRSVKASSQVTENLDTKSLLSLEEGEIVDSATSSPAKIVDPSQSLPEKTLPHNFKFDLLDPDELALKILEVKSPLPLKEIGNNQNSEKPPLLEKRSSLTVESTGLTDSLNSSKDERIENIAEFIANFKKDSSECKKDERSNTRMSYNNVSETIQPGSAPLEETVSKEKIQTTLSSSKNNPPALPFVENSDAVSTKSMNDNNGDDDWCLIAIDSPVKNFEENRKNRMLARNILITEQSEPPNIASADEPATKHLEEESRITMNAESERIVSNEIATPLVQPTKNISKSNTPAVLKSLRSTYHKVRKEMILSDTNSEQCKKVTVPNATNSVTKSLMDESETVQEIGNGINEPAEPINDEKCRSKSPVLKDADNNCEKKGLIDSFGGKNESENIAKYEKTVVSNEVTPCSDETNVSDEKSKVNNAKTRKEIATKIGASLKPDNRNSTAKESKGKQTGVCKTNLPNPSKVDESKKVGTKIKAEKSDENVESDTSKCLENGNKSGKTLSKSKVEGSNIKQKKEPRKLIVFARRRKPVHLEDSSTSSSVFMNQNSIVDTVSNSERTSDDNIEPLNSQDANNCETGIEEDDDQSQIPAAKNDFGNDNKTEFSNVEDNLKV